MKRSVQKKRTIVCAAATTAALSLTTGCGQENPTDVGGSLLPGGVSTYEVIIEPSRFLVDDTSFSGYFDARSVSYLLLARQFDGPLDANIISSVTIPATISVTDSAGNAATDTMPVFTGGNVVLALDTFAVQTAPAGATVRLYRLAEPYHAPSATWDLRVDTGAVDLPWATPGGSAGSLISTATYEAGSDTLRFPIDSATIAAWADPNSPVSGMVIKADVPGSRFRASDLAVVLDARSSLKPDTVFNTTLRPADRIFLFQPDPPATAATTIAGGTPAWRGMIQLRERLDTLSLPCANNTPNCSILLGDAAITAARLLFEPVAAVPGFAPEDSVGLIVRELLANPAVPVERSPMGALAGFARLAPPGLFDGTPGGAFEISITQYIEQFSDGDDVRPGNWLVLLGTPEGNTFGHAAFAGRPRLRLIISSGTDLRIQ